MALGPLPLEPGTPFRDWHLGLEPRLPQRDIEDWEVAGVPLPRPSKARPRLSPPGRVQGTAFLPINAPGVRVRTSKRALVYG